MFLQNNTNPIWIYIVQLYDSVYPFPLLIIIYTPFVQKFRFVIENIPKRYIICLNKVFNFKLKLIQLFVSYQCNKNQKFPYNQHTFAGIMDGANPPKNFVRGNFSYFL